MAYWSTIVFESLSLAQFSTTRLHSTRPSTAYPSLNPFVDNQIYPKIPALALHSSRKLQPAYALSADTEPKRIPRVMDHQHPAGFLRAAAHTPVSTQCGFQDTLRTAETSQLQPADTAQLEQLDSDPDRAAPFSILQPGMALDVWVAATSHYLDLPRETILPGLPVDDIHLQLSDDELPLYPLGILRMRSATPAKRWKTHLMYCSLAATFIAEYRQHSYDTKWLWEELIRFSSDLRSRDKAWMDGKLMDGSLQQILIEQQTSHAVADLIIPLDPEDVLLFSFQGQAVPSFRDIFTMSLSSPAREWAIMMNPDHGTNVVSDLGSSQSQRQAPPRLTIADNIQSEPSQPTNRTILRPLLPVPRNVDDGAIARDGQGPTTIGTGASTVASLSSQIRKRQRSGSPDDTSIDDLGSTQSDTAPTTPTAAELGISEDLNDYLDTAAGPNRYVCACRMFKRQAKCLAKTCRHQCCLLGTTKERVRRMLKEQITIKQNEAVKGKTTLDTTLRGRKFRDAKKAKALAPPAASTATGSLPITTATNAHVSNLASTTSAPTHSHGSAVPQGITSLNQPSLTYGDLPPPLPPMRGIDPSLDSYYMSAPPNGDILSQSHLTQQPLPYQYSANFTAPSNTYTDITGTQNTDHNNMYSTQETDLDSFLEPLDNFNYSDNNMGGRSFEGAFEAGEETRDSVLYTNTHDSFGNQLDFSLDG